MKLERLRLCKRHSAGIREVWTESWAEGESRIHCNNNGLGTECGDYQVSLAST